MANFKTHISFGVFIGIGFIVAGLITSLMASTEAIIWIFLAVLVGSFLPDLDMDEGVPFQILFGLLGAGLAGLIFLGQYQSGERGLKLLVLFPMAVFLLVRFGAGYVFEKFTNHRGIFHSVPAAVLFGLLTIWFLNFLAIQSEQKLFLGLAVSVGYLGHLVLDEIYSSVNLHGHSLLPKQSLGNALKFYSSSKVVTLLVYIFIFMLVTKLPETKELLQLFS
ncbi:MAG: metal-dependent hydrolase [Parcubacteria group bacterium]